MPLRKLPAVQGNTTFARPKIEATSRGIGWGGRSLDGRLRPMPLGARLAGGVDGIPALSAEKS